MLAEDGNFLGLARLNRGLMGKGEALDSGYSTVLHMDSTEIPVYGEEEESAYNGHFESTCFHPLLLFNRGGDCFAAKLRPGNVHSAEGWDGLLLPEIERQHRLGKKVAFRADAAFGKPEIYETLESRDVKYTIRIPASENLERDVAKLLPNQVGHPVTNRPCGTNAFSTRRQVGIRRGRWWQVEHHAGVLFPRLGFIVTNLTLPSRAVVRFYNKPRSGSRKASRR